MYLLYIFHLSSTQTNTHTYDFVVITSLSDPKKKNSFGCAANRKIGKVKDLSAPLRA
jgi:hypothetical protein